MNDSDMMVNTSGSLDLVTMPAPPVYLFTMMGVWASITGLLGIVANILAIGVFIRVKRVIRYSNRKWRILKCCKTESGTALLRSFAPLSVKVSSGFKYQYSWCCSWFSNFFYTSLFLNLIKESGATVWSGHLITPANQDGWANWIKGWPNWIKKFHLLKTPTKCYISSAVCTLHIYQTEF